MNFHGKQIELVKDNIYKISGDLRIKDITRTVILDAIRLGGDTAKDNQTITEWQISAIIKRSDYNLKLSRLKEVLAGDKVRIDIKVEFLLQRSDSVLF